METKKHMNHRVSFFGGGKESFLHRLQLLRKGRALQQAADDWEVPRSTLNNYFHRGSSPRLNVLEKIAKKESVSLEWLINGVGKEPELTKNDSLLLDNQLEDLNAILSALEPLEREKLTKLLRRRGVMYLLGLLDPDNQALLELREDKKRVALWMESMSEEQFREILSKIEISTGKTISEVEHSPNIRARA